MAACAATANCKAACAHTKLPSGLPPYHNNNNRRSLQLRLAVCHLAMSSLSLWWAPQQPAQTSLLSAPLS